MAAISNEHLRQIAYRIMGEQGFSTDGQGLLRAHNRWAELATPDERLALERALFLRWLEDLRAERRRPPVPLPLPAREERPRVVAAHVEDDEPESSPERVAQVSALKFRSESPEWQHDFPGGHPANDTQWTLTAGDQSPVPATVHAESITNPPARDQSPQRPAGPVTITTIPGHPAAVQQPSRKVAAYRQMFPELAFPVQTASGAKPLAEFTEQDIDYRIGQLREQRQDWRRANSGDEARIEERERLNAKDRVRIAERRQIIGDTEAEETRLAAAKREVAANGFAVIGELSPEALAACGFKRRVA